jgi:calcineurin-like phosphoesterase family protein
MMKFDKLMTSGTVWITSDTHYHHKNICRGVTNWRTQDGKIPVSSTRDFRDLDEMDSTIVNNINAKVGPDDTLIHLGDVAFGGFEMIGQFLDRLVCKNIHLVLGNHDHHISNDRGNIKDRFLSVSNYLEANIEGENFILCHYPLQSWNGLNKGFIHLHGHVHLSVQNKWGNGKRLDVGMDGNSMYPYKITEIVHMMDRRDIGSDLSNDHHLDDLVGVVG